MHQIDDTDILGQFYIRGDDRVSWPGILTLSPEATLRLLVLSSDSRGVLPAPFSAQPEGVLLDIIGETNSRGYVTLLRCACVHRRSSQHSADRAHTTEFRFRPSEVWVGPDPFESSALFNRMTLSFSGLHGVIGTKAIARKFLRTSEEKRAIGEVIGDVDELFYFDRAAKHHAVSLADPPAEVLFGSGYSASFSWIEGDSISTYDECIVVAREPMAADSLTPIGTKLERFLSFICMTTVRCSRFRLEQSCDESALPSTYERLWVLGGKQGTESVLFHEALSNCFQDPTGFTNALVGWMTPSVDQALARWLHLDSQDRNVISVGRFISVCQAVEILGREAKGGAPFDKGKFKSAAFKAAKAIVIELGAEYSTDDYENRFRQLVASSNRFSFRDHIHAFIDSIPPILTNALLPDRDAFVPLFVKMRNVLVHMESEALSDETAERHLGELTYRLLALFVAHQGTALGIDASRILGALANSSLGRSANHYIKIAVQRGRSSG